MCCTSRSISEFAQKPHFSGVPSTNDWVRQRLKEGTIPEKLYPPLSGHFGLKTYWFCFMRIALQFPPKLSLVSPAPNLDLLHGLKNLPASSGPQPIFPHRTSFNKSLTRLTHTVSSQNPNWQRDLKLSWQMFPIVYRLIKKKSVINVTLISRKKSYHIYHVV